MSISLGRRMQEPLQEFGSLAASTEDEFLALRMHPLQGEVERDRSVAGRGRDGGGGGGGGGVLVHPLQGEVEQDRSVVGRGGSLLYMHFLPGFRPSPI